MTLRISSTWTATFCGVVLQQDKTEHTFCCVVSEIDSSLFTSQIERTDMSYQTAAVASCISRYRISRENEGGIWKMKGACKEMMGQCRTCDQAAIN